MCRNAFADGTTKPKEVITVRVRAGMASGAGEGGERKNHQERDEGTFGVLAVFFFLKYLLMC